MATHNLTDQFKEMQRRINLGDRAKIARAAHQEVIAVLEAHDALRVHGVSPVLIGSYARHTAIWPGKDVDIFGRLSRHDITSIEPGHAYSLFREALSTYGSRVVEQPRSLKIEFGAQAGQLVERYLEAEEYPKHLWAGLNDLGFSFSVDVVPAVKWPDSDEWGIPQRDPQVWQRSETVDRWVKTNPEALTAVTQELNGSISVNGQGAYVPTVKALKQLRKHHLGGTKPSFLFYEFMLCDGFNAGSIAGDSWPDITSSAINYVVHRLKSLRARPVEDPVLGTPYAPAPSAHEVSRALSLLTVPEGRASEALSAAKCQAGYLWRQALGANGNEGYDSVFPVPPGCNADGTLIGAAVTNPLRGGTEERGFGA